MNNLLSLLIFITSLYPATINAQDQPKLLTTFPEIINALDSGAELNIVFHYGKCRLMIDSVEEKSPDVSGGMKIDEYEYFPVNTIRNPKGYIAFSKTVLISHSRHGYIWNYVKCRIYEDGAVEINARYINPLTLETKMNETFYGGLSDQSQDKGVFVYLN